MKKKQLIPNELEKEHKVTITQDNQFEIFLMSENDLQLKNLQNSSFVVIVHDNEYKLGIDFDINNKKLNIFIKNYKENRNSEFNKFEFTISNFIKMVKNFAKNK